MSLLQLPWYEFILDTDIIGIDRCRITAEVSLTGRIDIEKNEDSRKDKDDRDDRDMLQQG